MRLSQFDFNLPDELIAKYPLKNRDEARLMVVHKDTQEIEHKLFKDIIDYFDEDDLLVFNNSKVFPAILKGYKDKNGSEIEVFLLRELNPEEYLWDALVAPARKIRMGNKLYFDKGLVAEVIDNTTSRGRTIRFLYEGTYQNFKKMLNKLGKMPIPHFINREAEDKDKENYNHPFAKYEGSVVSPTAVLHFTDLLLKKLEIKGVKFTEITLHAGIGNISNIQVEDLSKHRMTSEPLIITEEAANTINEAIKNKKRICAVGTTVLKALETALTTKYIDPYEGWTNKFIFPPYEVKTANALIVNLHLPKTPMIIATAAFGGYRLIMKAYEIAVKEKYRFGTFGDAMLII